MDRYYVSEFIPGYTGYIPQKMNTFAMTSGEINRQLLQNKKVPQATPQEKLYYTKSVPHLLTDGDKIKYGYRSRYGISWITGPTDKVFPQQIPCNLIKLP